MSARFEEIDWRPTPKGDISLRRRRDPVTGQDVHEVKLGDEFLMSSLFTVGEEELARLGLAPVRVPGAELDVVVGGLGLGYTARTVLRDDRVRSLLVVEALGEVIAWHERGLVPLGEELTADARCRFVHGDFFAMTEADGFDPERPGRLFDAVLLDVDHAPDQVLHPSHAPFYEPAGLRALAARLRPGGVFALWSDDPPSEAFGAVLAGVFAESAAHVVTFDNPLRGGTSSNTVYVARTPAG
ncbi:MULTISPECIES: spermidine synthase [unclassified Streptomyces]|uniref:spermidine synthase n=1 Tax=unclassified Streptomyces TaxID=2593676 RepID=UPI0022B69E2A|nr:MULTISPECIES: spermidine synthase [unclassified Streptomyces]MCZ7415404.1 spermidine synthase [Streptomyces sp. WMMC897]MCZ7432333.1 spermidine synthase [Streptomyces sp. WMMC1477]